MAGTNLVNGIIALTLSGLFFFFAWSPRPYVAEVNPYEPPPLNSFSTPFIDLLTLGHRDLYDDFTLVWMLQVLAVDQTPSLDSDKVLELIHKVIRHGPRIESLYLLSCFVLDKHFARAKDCQPIIMKGLEAFPNSFRLPMVQGFMHAFRLSEPAQAAFFYNMAANTPNAPEYVRGVAGRLVRHQDITSEDLRRSVEIMFGSLHSSRFKDLLFNNRFNLPEGAGP